MKNADSGDFTANDFDPLLIALGPEEYEYAETKLTQNRTVWGYVKDKI